jgi:hypothetical protein
MYNDVNCKLSLVKLCNHTTLQRTVMLVQRDNLNNLSQTY